MLEDQVVGRTIASAWCSGARLRGAVPRGFGRLRGLRIGAVRRLGKYLLDQRRLAGIGNIYASEILHRAGVEPRRRAGALSREEWEAVAAGTTRVLREAIGRMGTTFSTYRTLWNEPGGYGERLRVYDRAGEPCRRCRTPIRRIVQGQRSTFYCPACQPRRGGGSGDGGRSRRRPGGGPVRRQGAGSRAGPRTSAASRETRNPSPAGRNRAGTSS